MYSHFPIKRDQKDLNMLSIKIFTHADVMPMRCVLLQKNNSKII